MYVFEAVKKVEVAGAVVKPHSFTRLANDFKRFDKTRESAKQEGFRNDGNDKEDH